MIWWILAYLAVAVCVFFAFLRLEPLDGRAWLTVLTASLFWPVTVVLLALP